MSNVVSPERPDESGKGKGNPYQPPIVVEADAPAASQLEIDMVATAEDNRQFYAKNGWLKADSGRAAKPIDKGTKVKKNKPAVRRPTVMVNEAWKQDLNAREEKHMGALQPPCQ
jgi:hypothetical protein